MTNQDIVKGSALMVFLGGSAIGFATSHALSLTANTTEVSTKDHGDYPAVVAQSIGWEVTAENLYSDTGETTYMKAMLAKTPVDIKFAKVANYSATDEKGIIDNGEKTAWTAGTVIAEGKALITSFSINAGGGENATMSVTFTGVGALNTPQEQ